MSHDYELERTGSLCKPSPQIKLLSALECRDFIKFEKTLKSGLSNGSIDINYVYDEPHCQSILEIACSSSYTRKFVDCLIKNGVNVNYINCFTKRSALHYAVEFSDDETVTSLIDNKNTDINIRDSHGNTPLHLAASLNKVSVIDALLKHPSIKVNEINRKHQTAIHIAASKGHRDSVVVLLNNIDIDIDELKDFRDQTGREMIKKKFPDIELRGIKSSGFKETSLFAVLQNGDLRTFKELAKGKKKQLDEDDGRSTYLQYACENGLLEIVQFLLDCGVNPNKTCAANRKYPIMIAGFQGYLKIVQTLTEHGNIVFDDADDGTVLHAILNGIVHCTDILGVSAELRSHVKCIEYLLKKVPNDSLNINYQDVNGNTVLHIATKINDPSIVHLLLDHGAYIGYQNKFGDMPISYMQSKMFASFLNSCITTNDKRVVDEDYKIIYNYQFLAPPKLCLKHELDKASDFLSQPMEKNDSFDVISETAPLVAMSKVPELRPLLKHPVLTSFLNLKWYTIRRYFWMNLTFYVTFWALLTTYILSVYGVPQPSGTENSMHLERFRLIFWYPTFVFCGLLLLREIFQFSISPRKYCQSFENILEVGIVLCTFALLFCHTGCQTNKAQYAAIAILLSWTELVLLIGRHPLLSTNVEMFKVVCCNFLKLLSWYSILILAFSLSFYVLFRPDKNMNQNSSAETDKFFQDPGMSIFKSVIMLTGEFDAGSIPFDSNPGTSHLLFILFVFLIAIVLFNLLNGLAVSDTQAIKSDAELVGNVCRAKLITYIEQMAIGDPFPCLNFFDKLTCLCCCVPIRRTRRVRTRHIKSFYTRINLFPKLLPDSKAHVYPNKGNTIDFTGLKDQSNDSDCFASCRNCTDWHMDRKIMKTTRELLEERENKSIEFPDYSDIMRRYSLQLEEYRLKLASLEETSKRTQRQLSELVTLLKQKL